MPLKVAGEGEPPKYGEYLGVVGPEKRAELMSRAKAVFMPTLYVEPYGADSVEAMLCGTPIVTTDWGAPTEYNLHGRTGYRCRTFGEFLEAARIAPDLDKVKIREYALNMLSTDVVKWRYQNYFNRLDDLRREGPLNLGHWGIEPEPW
nr:glycosyltransferase [Micromonospora sp. DSM 115978]